MPTTSQAHSALIMLSQAQTCLERGERFVLDPEDLPWVKVILELLPQMPLQDER